ncbi:7-cyano-7-deazaguanine synthase [Candidatus Vecturithrix granuli]|uniref:7-cyano-7-deazaguanine synthase n=1 Tax=Vecturithrix granuli TaxID=1499967 RepID=A0A081C3Z6_VECG1|nr:7-cyano-7-deazaguanine synthase [Candidatus Vecturithrix granuli]
MKNYPLKIQKNFDEDPRIIDEIERILQIRRGFIFQLAKHEPIVFIISGGLDSSLILDKILKELQCTIFPVYVERGAKAEAFEKESVIFFTNYYQEKYPGLLKDLMLCKTDIPPKDVKQFIPAERLMTIGHPMRNAILQSIGVQYGVGLSYANQINIHTIFTATSPDDTFPHSSLLALRCLTLAACIDNGDWEWQVTSPLVETYLWGKISKKDMVLYATENKLPLEKTRTCTSGSSIACGICPECLCRLNAFKMAGIKDPINYVQR